MTGRALFKFSLKLFIVFIAFLLLISIFLFSPLDRSPLQEQDFYKQTISRADSLQLEVKQAQSITNVGWNTVNITPDHAMPMAGYRPRDRFDGIHDSLFARVLVVNNGTSTVALLSIDLLLFPKVLHTRLLTAIQKIGIDFLYVGASHTHNGIGAWDESVLAKFSVGPYDSVWVSITASRIQRSIQQAINKQLPARIGYAEIEAKDLVSHRLVANREVDGKLRCIKILRSDSSRGIFFTFSAHPTSIGKSSRLLSGDYPAAVIGKLERGDADFAMFMAGMVGSHKMKYDANRGKDFAKVEIYSDSLVNRINQSSTKFIDDTLTLSYATLPITFGPAQLRVAENWRVRPWVTSALMGGTLQGAITMLNLGPIKLIGTPCDFSGELFSSIKTDSNPVLITSFNGDYVGYVTHDELYDIVDNPEVRNMNWVGPYFGSYYKEVISILNAKSISK